MNQHENNILIEVATNVKWLKETNDVAHSAMLKQLRELNSEITKTRTRSIVNRYGLIGCFGVISIIISILLHLIGVY